MDKLRLDEIYIIWESDEYADLSYLDQGSERLDSYGFDWCMTGCRAVAIASYSIGNGNRRQEWLGSGGLWGIESDMNIDCLREIEDDQIADLRDHVSHFHVDTSNFDELASRAGGRR